MNKRQIKKIEKKRNPIINEPEYTRIYNRSRKLEGRIERGKAKPWRRIKNGK